MMMNNDRRHLLGLGLTGAAALSATGALAAPPKSSSLSLEQRIQRAEDLHEVENVINRYEIYLGMGYLEEAVAEFALKTPDVKADTGWGVYEGPASIRRLILDLHKVMIGDRREPATLKPGAMYVLANTMGTVEVAEDGRTAKGLWFCPGFSTRVDSGDKNNDQAIWAWAKRAVDFIKEDGEWKIWHYKVYGILYTPFDTPWTKSDSGKNLNFDWVPAPLKPDHPTTPSTGYSSDRPVAGVPLPPRPYRTFSETFPYL